MGQTILKKRVDISVWKFIMSMLTIAALIGLCVWQFSRTDNEVYCWLLLVIVTVWGFCTLFYCPMYVKLRADSLDVETSLRVKSFPLNDIAEVKICTPTKSEWRLCGSSGYFGYWGWFRDPDVGKYFAYYGMPTQTFFIRLKSGKQYMLGCRDAKVMANALADRLIQIQKTQA